MDQVSDLILPLVLISKSGDIKSYSESNSHSFDSSASCGNKYIAVSFKKAKEQFYNIRLQNRLDQINSKAPKRFESSSQVTRMRFRFAEYSNQKEEGGDEIENDAIDRGGRGDTSTGRSRHSARR